MSEDLLQARKRRRARRRELKAQIAARAREAIKTLESPCHQTRIKSRRYEGVLLGICIDCKNPVMEIDEETGEKWWINPETLERERLVNAEDYRFKE